MIPSAQTLADILNDPAIPSDAKPPQLPGRWDVHPDEPSLLLKTNTITHTGKAYLAYEANAALFWSMSAWLWDVGNKTMGVWRAADLGFMASTQCDKRAWAETPTEALADVVREVAKRQTR